MYKTNKKFVWFSEGICIEKQNMRIYNEVYPSDSGNPKKIEKEKSS